jgi:CRP/FNR family transcriptional regulator
MLDVAALRALVPALAELPEATLRRVVTAAVERSYAKGATLYRAGDAADGLYVIVAGRVRVSRETTTRVELLHTESAGGVLGEIPVFGGGPFPATANALAATRCLFVPVDAVQRLLNDDPAFVRFALAGLAERARVLLKRIDELTATTITARVAQYVLSRSSDTLGTSFTLGMSQEELARELGTAREVIVRALRSLIAAGAIARAGRSRFAIRSVTVLQAIASP